MSSAFNIPAGWKIDRQPTGELIINGPHVGVVVRADATEPRMIPEEVLFMLASALLAVSPPVDAVPGEPVAPPEWTAHRTVDGLRIVIDSADFEHDASLILTGDFATEGEKLSFAGAIADKLNCLAASVASRAGSEPVAADQAVATPEASDDSWVARVNNDGFLVEREHSLPLAPGSKLYFHPDPDATIRAVELAQAFSRGHDAGWASAMAHVTSRPSVLPAQEVDEADFDANLADPPSPQDSAPIAPAAAAEPSEVEYEVQLTPHGTDDVMPVAGSTSLAEALNYARQYEEEGSVQVYEVTRRPIGGASAGEAQS